MSAHLLASLRGAKDPDDGHSWLPGDLGVPNVIAKPGVESGLDCLVGVDAVESDSEDTTHDADARAAGGYGLEGQRFESEFILDSQQLPKKR